MCWIQHRWRLPQGHYTRTDATLMASSTILTILILLIAALTQSI
jgi:hypothetical protein